MISCVQACTFGFSYEPSREGNLQPLLEGRKVGICIEMCSWLLSDKLLPPRLATWARGGRQQTLQTRLSPRIPYNVVGSNVHSLFWLELNSNSGLQGVFAQESHHSYSAIESDRKIMVDPDLKQLQSGWMADCKNIRMCSIMRREGIKIKHLWIKEREKIR